MLHTSIVDVFTLGHMTNILTITAIRPLMLVSVTCTIGKQSKLDAWRPSSVTISDCQHKYLNEVHNYVCCDS